MCCQCLDAEHTQAQCSSCTPSKESKLMDPFAAIQDDAVVLRDLQLVYALGSASPWPPSVTGLPSPQPLVVSVRLVTGDGRFANGAALDSLDQGDTVSYAAVADAFSVHLAARAPQSGQHTDFYHRAEEVAEALAQVALWDCGVQSVDVQLALPDALRHGASAGVVVSRSRNDYDYLGVLAPRHTVRSPPRAAVDDRLFVQGLRVSCVIGVLDFEREAEQDVVVDLVAWPSRCAGQAWLDKTQGSEVDMGIGTRRLATTVREYIRTTSFLTLEALATSVASHALALPLCTSSVNLSAESAIRKICVKIEKPSAVTFCSGPGVCITRTSGPWQRQFSTSARQPSSSLLVSLANLTPYENGSHTLERSVLTDQPAFSTSESRSHTNTLTHSQPFGDEAVDVFLGLGSNLGDRMGYLTRALVELERPVEDGGLVGAQIKDASFVWESQPMYVEDQPMFLNASCKIRTILSPTDLLKGLKGIEGRLGRNILKTDKSARTIDLDILLYGNYVVDEAQLRIPHVGIASREFVLRPLCDMAPYLRIPGPDQTVTSLLQRLMTVTTTPTSCRRAPMIKSVLLPGIENPGQSPSLDLSLRTYIMAIINCTPDSFSDGGDAILVENAVRMALSHIQQGADVIDIGGMSTRPGAPDVESSEEIARTVPVIAALRLEHGVKCHISIDTFRADVARAAVDAGATIINDVTGGDGDPDMLSTMAELDVPVCLMHMRGNSQTMQAAENVHYEGNDVVAGVRRELGLRVTAALDAGVKRWNIVVDPGIGFAKSIAGNVSLLHNLSSLARPTLIESTVSSATSLEGFPLLVGPSRKGFLGKLCERDGHMPDPKAREFATAAAVSACVRGGAHIVRVHDTAAMRDVCAVADALERQQR